MAEEKRGSIMNPKVLELVEVCCFLDLPQITIKEWIDLKLINPYDSQNMLFDEEDLERMSLILNLQEVHGVDIESTDIILHLLDQIHLLQAEIKFLRRNK